MSLSRRRSAKWLGLRWTNVWAPIKTPNFWFKICWKTWWAKSAHRRTSKSLLYRKYWKTWKIKRRIQLRGHTFCHVISTRKYKKLVANLRSKLKTWKYFVLSWQSNSRSTWSTMSRWRRISTSGLKLLKVTCQCTGQSCTSWWSKQRRGLLARSRRSKMPCQALYSQTSLHLMTVSISFLSW